MYIVQLYRYEINSTYKMVMTSENTVYFVLKIDCARVLNPIFEVYIEQLRNQNVCIPLHNCKCVETVSWPAKM